MQNPMVTMTKLIVYVMENTPLQLYIIFKNLQVGMYSIT